MRFATTLTASLTAAFTAFVATAATAQQDLPVIGRPVDKAMGFQPAATELAHDLHALDTFILYIITAITLFVTGLILWVIIRHNRRANPVPSKFTHNSTLEIAWTLLPILVLIVIGTFSLPVLFKQQEIPTADITIKATGKQWYWTYEYPDHEFEFDSYMIGAPATGGDYRLNEEIEAQLVSWTIPAFGVKQDGVPGRLAQLWFKAEKEGVYFGQCSELCGIAHSYMPITVKVVSEAAYQEWLQGAIEEYAGKPLSLTVAQAN